MEQYVLDTSAIFCYLENEDGTETVEEILDKAEDNTAMVYIASPTPRFIISHGNGLERLKPKSVMLCLAYGWSNELNQLQRSHDLQGRLRQNIKCLLQMPGLPPLPKKPMRCLYTKTLSLNL